MSNYPKSLRVLEFLHYGGDLPVLHDEYTVRQNGTKATKRNVFLTERRGGPKVKLDRMESWLSRERMLTDFHCWKDSNGNEILQSTFGMVQEYLEVYPEALSSIEHFERNADRQDNKERKEYYRRNNVQSKWFNEEWLKSAKPRKGQP